jgi:hypothetical protein
MRDDRTDNMHGNRDFRDPNLWRFPRTSKEAGFGDYKPMYTNNHVTKCDVCIGLTLIAIILGALILWQ